ncbi:MAG: DUF362 domain-containing protein [Endomicrobium sp.]|jgi:uncharacterized protein (DUF362 family)|uniref:DUF362 domain-containing protein n=1 Tax=Candidatus Endomicrobiellum cubanum TaxID=3242325 RepID=UPI0028177D43|nr:DUF362 domain-containing protein [Endomicrobium sp.]
MIKVAYTNATSYELDTVKEALKVLFNSLGYDTTNPLGHIIKPGMRVFLKPNWVASKWRESCNHKDDLFCVITHPNVIEAVADFVDIALDGCGMISIGDNPSIDANFEELLINTKIERLRTKYRVPCEILDLRPLVCKDLHDYGDKEKMCAQMGDPRGYTQVNLSKKSLFNKVNSKLFRGVFKQRAETIKAHTGNRQLYTFSNSIYDADVFISLPKMKTHHKSGTTLNLKGLVGTIGQKNQLIHWRVGFPLIGGDEYSSFWQWVKGTFFTGVKSRGSWHGNDTIWRMVVDLYSGMILKKRGYFSIVDGILAGEGDGPFCPHSKKANTLIAGEDFLAVDIVTSKLMGFNPLKIPYLNHFIKNNSKILKEIVVLNKCEVRSDFLFSDNSYLNFVPPTSWKILKGN